MSATYFGTPDRNPYLQNDVLKNVGIGRNDDVIFGNHAKHPPKVVTKHVDPEPVSKTVPNDTATEKPVGRPKNAKLSELAAKRKLGRAKKTFDPAISVSKGSDKTVSASDRNTLGNEKCKKKSFDITNAEMLILNQNITHMATQVRQEPILPPELVQLTRGLRCSETSRCTKQPSRGMGVLFPGKKKTYRSFCAKLFLNPPSFQRPATDTVTVLDFSSEYLTAFDFSTCPDEAVAIDVKKTFDALNQKRNRHAKRLIAGHQGQAKVLKKTSTKKLDTLSAKRLLKKRMNDGADRCFEVVLCGPPSAGKSSIVSQLQHSLDPASICEKKMAKVKWEADKAGLPQNYLSWMIDELPGERRCGHSWDLTETALNLPSGQSCMFYDCPGDRLGLFSDLLVSAHAVIVTVDVVSMADGNDEETEHVRDLFRVIKERSTCFPTHTIVLLNQMDRCHFSTQVANMAKHHLNSIIRALGMHDVELQVVPSCALTGGGLTPLKGEAKPENGIVNFAPNVVEILEHLQKVTNVSSEPCNIDLKLPVLQVRDVYENMGAGFTVIAFVAQGLVAPGQSLVCEPSGVTLSVRNVLLPRAGRLQPVRCAAYGETVHLVLWQVEMSDVTRGSIICSPSMKPSEIDDGACLVSQRFEAIIETVNLHGRSLTIGRQLVFHGFGSSVHAYLSRLLWTTTAATTDTQPKVKLQPLVVSREGATVGIELILEAPHVCVPCLGLGMKFSLMDRNSLLGTGNIKKVLDDQSVVYSSIAPDCTDSKRLLFSRTANFETMDVD